MISVSVPHRLEGCGVHLYRFWFMFQETEEEKADTLNRVEQDRKPQIEAAIVRIMKDRRTLDHNLLIAEVSTQLSPLFLPNITDIKVRIESLIDRDFLMRVDDRTYSYIA